MFLFAIIRLLEVLAGKRCRISNERKFCGGEEFGGKIEVGSCVKEHLEKWFWREIVCRYQLNGNFEENNFYLH